MIIYVLMLSTHVGIDALLASEAGTSRTVIAAALCQVVALAKPTFAEHLVALRSYKHLLRLVDVYYLKDDDESQRVVFWACYGLHTLSSYCGPELFVLHAVGLMVKVLNTPACQREIFIGESWVSDKGQGKPSERAEGVIEKIKKMKHSPR